MDIIRTLADPGGIDGWGKAGLGLDGAIDHRLGLLAKPENGGWRRTAMANGVPLEAEPRHACQLKGWVNSTKNLTHRLERCRQE